MADIAMWTVRAGADSTTQYDGAKQFDDAAGAEVFWTDILGPALIWMNPKTDWTLDDYYNAGDLNRVELNTDHVAKVLEWYSSQVISMITVTDRTMIRFEFDEDLERIENNAKQLMEQFYMPVGWQQKKNWLTNRLFDYRDANRLENNLLLLRELLMMTIDSLRYCGTFACGEDGDIY